MWCQIERREPEKDDASPRSSRPRSRPRKKGGAQPCPCAPGPGDAPARPRPPIPARTGGARSGTVRGLFEQRSPRVRPIGGQAGIARAARLQTGTPRPCKRRLLIAPQLPVHFRQATIFCKHP